MKATEYLAIYAALLSTFVFFWNVRRATPRIKVDVVFGIDEIDGEHTPGAYISIKNPSAHTVHLAHISILYPYRSITKYELLKHAIKYKRLPFHAGWVHSSLSHFDVKDGCPLELEPGKSHGILFPEYALEKAFEDSTRRVIRVEVQDQLWRTKYSKEFEYPKSNAAESNVST